MQPHKYECLVAARLDRIDIRANRGRERAQDPSTAVVNDLKCHRVEPTENELQHMLAHSPLRAHLAAPAEFGLPSPPLALGIGHVALLLASGHLDGVVHPEGHAPHVVRGTARKREYIAEESETKNDDGTVTKKTVISEKIELVGRTVDLLGNIQTFMETDAKEE
jgi:hypothetical protein